MATIKIQRKRKMAWWPVLLLLLIPLAWYLWRGRMGNGATPRGTSPAASVPASP